MRRQHRTREYRRGKYNCTVDPLFDLIGIRCMTTDNFCFYLQNKLIQTSQTGGQWYSDTSPFSIPWVEHLTYNIKFVVLSPAAMGTTGRRTVTK